MPKQQCLLRRQYLKLETFLINLTFILSKLYTKFKLSIGCGMTSAEIISLRKSLGLNQVDFARLFDAHVMTISKWERGVSTPSPYQVSLMQHFKRTADSKSEKEKKELAEILVGAGIIAALIWLLGKK